MITESEVAKRLLAAALYAARKHRDQKRKDQRTPYINHPIGVAELLAHHGVSDGDTLVAALLHDVLEDTETSPEEIRSLFGLEVVRVVQEVTDDKHLPEAERKQLQVRHASGLSNPARLIRLADKISNVNDLSRDTPPAWSLDRKMAYIQWAEQVIAIIRGTHPGLEQLFDETVAQKRQVLSQ